MSEHPEAGLTIDIPAEELAPLLSELTGAALERVIGDTIADSVHQQVKPIIDKLVADQLANEGIQRQLAKAVSDAISTVRGSLKGFQGMDHMLREAVIAAIVGLYQKTVRVDGKGRPL